MLIFVHAHVPLARILLGARTGARAFMLVSLHPTMRNAQATLVPAVVTIELHSPASAWA